MRALLPREGEGGIEATLPRYRTFGFVAQSPPVTPRAAAAAAVGEGTGGTVVGFFPGGGRELGCRRPLPVLWTPRVAPECMKMCPADLLGGRAGLPLDVLDNQFYLTFCVS